jgi:hypothetical protein
VRRAYQSLDAALGFLAPYGPELANGFTSHAPMVAEALCALDRPEAVLPWLERARADFRPRPVQRAPLAPAAWRAALGQAERTADWQALLADELAEEGWRAVARRWLVRLAPGACADALHGVIRVGHAVRALELEETAPRRRELADALGAWAAAYQTLPTPAGRSPAAPGSEPLAPDAALARVPLQPPAERRFAGSIVSALASLEGFRPFAPVIDWLEPGADPQASLPALARAFARLYLANAKDAFHSVIFVHGITSAVALRSLVPLLTADEGRELVRRVWQAGAALQASLGWTPPLAGEVERPPEAPETLIDLALASGDDHAVKCTEACLREHALSPAPVYLAAARRAISLHAPG